MIFILRLLVLTREVLNEVYRAFLNVLHDYKYL